MCLPPLPSPLNDTHTIVGLVTRPHVYNEYRCNIVHCIIINYTQPTGRMNKNENASLPVNYWTLQKCK